MGLDADKLKKLAVTLRVLSAEAVERAASGHPAASAALTAL